MKIQIINQNINNLKSLMRALEFINSNVQIEVIAEYKQGLLKPDLILLPGVGHFGAAMTALKVSHLDEYIRNYATNGGKIVGICLGMHLLLSESEESPGEKGLDIISGTAKKLNYENERVPNVGWNNVIFKESPVNTPNSNEEPNFYFTHSYYAAVLDKFVLGISNHGQFRFPAVIKKNSTIGIQFHPEKSGRLGSNFLKEIIERMVM